MGAYTLAEWIRVPCEKCGADVGSKCQTAKGRAMYCVHARRWNLANGIKEAPVRGPEWVDTENGGRQWSVGWQQGRGTPYTTEMLATLRLCADDHLDKVQKYNDDPERDGPERCPASVQVVADRLLVTISSLTRDLASARTALAEAREAMRERRGYCPQWEWKYGEVWDDEDARIDALAGEGV